MIEIHPEILDRDGRRYVMLPYDEFLAMRESLEDLDDLRELRTAIAEQGDAPARPLADVKRDLGL